MLTCLQIVLHRHHCMQRGLQKFFPLLTCLQIFLRCHQCMQGDYGIVHLFCSLCQSITNVCPNNLVVIPNFSCGVMS